MAGSMLMASCASTSSSIAFHEEAPAKDGDVVIYVYRLSSMAGAAAPWVVRLDGKDVAILRQNAYIALHTTPGAHTIMVGDSPPGLGGAVLDDVMRDKGTALLEPNTSYYIRCAGFKISFVGKEAAMKELPAMKLDYGRPVTAKPS